MSSSAGRLPGLTVLALCLAATTPQIMTARAGTPAPAPAALLIAFGENWVSSKSRMTGSLTTTLTDPIIPGTYRCTIGWDVFNESTGQMFTLPPTTVPLTITP
jgi:hypothetical protein